MVALRNAAQGAARIAWDAIQEADLDGTYAPPVDRIARAQRDAARAAAAYLQAFTASELGHPVRTPSVDTKPYVGQSWDGQRLEDALRSPLIGVKADIGKGTAPGEALRLGSVKVLRGAGLNVDFVSRGALTDAMAASPHVKGWRRAVSGTCDACMALSDIHAPAGTPLDIHPGCECVAEPTITGTTNHFPRPTGYQLFAAMSAAKQDAQFGPDKAQLLRDDDIQLSDLIDHSPIENGPSFITTKPTDQLPAKGDSRDG